MANIVSDKTVKKVFYAVRNGITKGIYENWGKAVNAGFKQQQGYGNAIKCTTMVEAEAFLEEPAFPTGPSGKVKSYIKKQHFLVRFSVFSVMATTLIIIFWNIALWAEKKVGCDNILLGSTLLCKSLIKMKQKVQEQMETLLNLFFIQIMGIIFVASSYVAGILD